MPAHALAPLPLPRSGRSPISNFWTGLWHALVRRIAGCGAELFSVRLAAAQELRFREAVGWTVACRGGTVWITQEGDARDIFLNRGEAFALDRAGVALVRACRDAVLSIRAPGRRERAASLANSALGAAEDHQATDDRADLAWLRALYPENGPWNATLSYRRAGLL